MSGETGNDGADDRPVDPAPHRTKLWRTIFVAIVVLGVAAIVVGVVSDAR